MAYIQKYLRPKILDAFAGNLWFYDGLSANQTLADIESTDFFNSSNRQLGTGDVLYCSSTTTSGIFSITETITYDTFSNLFYNIELNDISSSNSINGITDPLEIVADILSIKDATPTQKGVSQLISTTTTSPTTTDSASTLFVRSLTDDLNNGYLNTPIIHVTADVDALMGEYIFEVDTTANDIIIKLPLLSSKPSDITTFIMEFRFLIKGGSNTLTLLADSSDEMINSTAPSVNSYTTNSVGDIILMKYCANNGSPIWIREV